MAKRETQIRVRYGSAATERNGVYRKVRLVCVSKDFLWLGAGEHDGIAWISGRKAMKDIRDALTAMLKEGGAK